MKVAVIGSRKAVIHNLGDYLPEGTTEIVSGGAKGIDSCAELYARGHGLALKVFLPDYARFGRGTPLKRNLEIIAYADEVLAFWDGRSRGTKFVIDACHKQNRKVTIIPVPSEDSSDS